MSLNRRKQPGVTVLGLGLFLLGGWAAARAFGINLIPLTQLWPIIPMLIGVALLTQFSAEPERGGLIFWGVVATLMGLFMCAFTLHIGRLSWNDLARYWPLIPVIIGAGFLAMYIADGMQNDAILRPAYLIGGFGLFLLPFTTGVLGGAVFNQVARYWYFLLIPLAILIFLQMRSRNRSQPPGEG